MDGDWEAALISNPVCSSAPGCGPWQQPMIDNPDYYHDAEPFKMTPLGGIGIELWTMSDSIYFDNILITDNVALADNLAKETYDLKMSVIDATSGNIFKRILDYSNKNPWLYAVYVVLVGLPLVLIITFCCTGSSSKNEGGDKSSLNDPKKTDAVQDDDEGEEVDAEGDGEVNTEEEEVEEDEEEAEEQAEEEPPAQGVKHARDVP